MVVSPTLVAGMPSSEKAAVKAPPVHGEDIQAEAGGIGKRIQHRLTAVDIHHHWVGATIIGRIAAGQRSSSIRVRRCVVAALVEKSRLLARVFKGKAAVPQGQGVLPA